MLINVTNKCRKFNILDTKFFFFDIHQTKHSAMNTHYSLIATPLILS